MPNSLATARGDSHLALVREVPAVPRRTGSAGVARTRMPAPAPWVPEPDTGEPSPFSTAHRAAAATRRAFGAIALVAALGTVLLAALAASATLALAGR